MKRLNIKNPGFDTELANLLHKNSNDDTQAIEAAAKIVADVREKKDAALNEYTRKFDNTAHKDNDFLITEEEIDAACDAVSTEIKQAIDEAIRRVSDYHLRQLPDNMDYNDADGVRLGWKWEPIESVGIYVPGGTAIYPSSVVMNAIPAKVAGVKNLVMAVPAPDGKISDVVLATARACHINKIYKIGGAQAVAALAYGTETVPQVDKIVGPGNSYVQAAKKIVFGQVGIDNIAGPSEIAIIADGKNNPDWLAADLLSQAEHNKDSKVFLISDDMKMIEETIKSADELLNTITRKEIAEAALQNYGIAIEVESLSEACAISNRIAPEHLELAVEYPDRLLKKIKHAGAIFLGRYTPEVIGDYVAGPSHVLPTSGTARFSSGLSILDFMKRSSLIGCDKTSLPKLGDAAEIIAKQEGLDAHALSILIRRGGLEVAEENDATNENP